MADIAITVDGGTSKRLLTAGKYCDKNILVTATGGGGGEPEPPDDGKTRLYITIPPNVIPDRPPPRNEVPLYIQQTVDSGVTIDWGDGSETETLPGTGPVNTIHTYEQAGDYVISLDPADGCELGFGDGTMDYCVFGSEDDSNYCYRTMLKKAIIGYYGVTNIGNSAFGGCSALRSIKMPNNVTIIGDRAFGGCPSLYSTKMSENITNIGAYAFSVNYAAISFKIPSNVIEIGRGAFSGCLSAKEYHIIPKEPPSLDSIYAFQNIPSDCIIYVPVGSLEAYQTATNWSTYAGQMREEGT